MANYEDDQFSLAETFSSPWASIPWIIGSALAAGATPGTARLAGGANVGLQSMMGIERQAAEKRKKERLSQSLDKLSSITTPFASTKLGIDPEKISFELPEQRLSEALSGRPREISISEQEITSQPGMPSNRLAPPAPLPTYEATEQKPIYTPQQREYLKLIGQADPEAALKSMGSTLFKERKPMTVPRGGTAIDESGKVIYQAPEASSWRPYQVDLGDRIETGVVSSTGERRSDNVVPKGAAPLAPERVEDLQERRALQGESIEARRQAAKDAARARLEAARERKDYQREILEDRKDARADRQAQLAITERDRAVRPEDIHIAEISIAKSAAARGIDKLPPKDQAAALKQIADSYGMEIQGTPRFKRGGWFGNDSLIGDFSLKPKPLITRTERNRGSAGQSAKDPTATPRRLKFDAQGNLIP